MGTEVLHPVDVLNERLKVPQASRRNFSAAVTMTRKLGGNSSHRKTSARPEKKKINSVEEKKDVHRRKVDGTAPAPVIILKRGESLDTLTAKLNSRNSKVKSSNSKSVDESTVFEKKGSKPALASQICVSPPQKIDEYAGSSFTVLPASQICISTPQKIDEYAGSGFTVSPAPQSLPVPSFCNKKIRSVDDSATRDLRRLLRLD
ncbi:uncharacterized protein LOC127248515 [Andrographis paniculata]|uniref:uncharacterized protein LOC127248515 n=1 Tax=Andrographis paniculata TaxID=175694 RepID=UPI0021E7FAE9|nr:uncharacterized protein LOC127248515 [Andrographis paniculata]